MEKSLFYRKMMERWARLLFQADDYTMMLLSATVKQCIVHLIQWLTDYTDAEDKSIVMLLNGSNMPAMLGITAESVNRILAELKRLNILCYLEGGRYEYSEKYLLKYANSA